MTRAAARVNQERTGLLQHASPGHGASRATPADTCASRPWARKHVMVEHRSKKAGNLESTFPFRLTMNLRFNYRHLYYFWVVAKEGGMARAATRLDMAVQTVSTQVRELERSLGCTLLKPAGRGLALTPAGFAVMRQADRIFELGEQLPDVVRDAADSPVIRLAVGVSDALPKLVVRQLLQPIMLEPNLRLLCRDGKLEGLLGDLALHRLDVVIADRPGPPNPNLKLYSHALGSSGFAWYAPPVWLAIAKRGYPHSLSKVPILLPTAHAAIRTQLDQWFERHSIAPRVAGEFEDSALLKTFGAAGMGVFPAAESVHDELVAHFGVRRVGACEGVEEHFIAIGTEKKVQHPFVQRVLASRR